MPQFETTQGIPYRIAVLIASTDTFQTLVADHYNITKNFTNALSKCYQEPDDETEVPTRANVSPWGQYSWNFDSTNYMAADTDEWYVSLDLVVPEDETNKIAWFQSKWQAIVNEMRAKVTTRAEDPTGSGATYLNVTRLVAEEDGLLEEDSRDVEDPEDGKDAKIYTVHLTLSVK